MFGIHEFRVGSVVLPDGPSRSFSHLIYARGRYSPPDPVDVHLGEVVFPDLPVVWDQIVPRDAFPKRAVDPFLEVRRLGGFSIDYAIDAFLYDVHWKRVEVDLEGVLDVRVFEVDV